MREEREEGLKQMVLDLETIGSAVRDVNDSVIEWRRDIHAHPELSNREVRTAGLVAEHLESLGIRTTRGIAHTGVVGILEGGRPGRVVALRADMDALPVTEETDVPFASKVVTEYEGERVGVMHACGHDAHTAILMGVASVLAGLRDDLAGTIKFIFQPAEEGAPRGEEGGAQLMVREGVLENPGVDCIFGLHVTSRFETGTIAVRPGPLLAANDSVRIKVRGRQTHGAYPWLGVDPIVAAAQIITALQTIPSRQLDSLAAPSVVTIGQIRGGVRNNIIPGEVDMWGTLRSLDAGNRAELLDRVRKTAEKIAESAGAEAIVEIETGYPVTWNDPDLARMAEEILRVVAGESRVVTPSPVLGAEDFAFYQQKVPGVFFYLGVRPPGKAESGEASNHSPRFFVDEAGLELGVKAMTALALEAGQQIP